MHAKPWAAAPVRNVDIQDLTAPRRWTTDWEQTTLLAAQNHTNFKLISILHHGLMVFFGPLNCLVGVRVIRVLGMISIVCSCVRIIILLHFPSTC
jgi:hypothetical protein